MYDLQIFSKIRVVPYCSCIYKLSKFLGKCFRDKAKQESQKCLKVCVVFEGIGCINEMLDLFSSLKENKKKTKVKLLNIIYH